MVIHESLRLYPPVPLIAREAFKDMKFGDINVPKGAYVWTSLLTLHQNVDFWGPDANQFNPERFGNGISGACKYSYVYMPFGVGPRICVGQHFAMTELKILLTLILSNFTFSLSPNYQHFPIMKLIIEPKFGVDLLVKKL
ncbi:Cytochrome P450 [Corchorus olitorius]|uniref:Cytochrome P450 n=1 Tax=Corchorus olitorius TaxID=93759 RepID=A0A1R3I0L4_9ROSI|nr:Cytochrome P450 [Corchorus olitorius]